MQNPCAYIIIVELRENQIHVSLAADHDVSYKRTENLPLSLTRNCVTLAIPSNNSLTVINRR